MMMIGQKIAELSKSTDVKMDKVHITVISTYPVFITYTRGTDVDSPQLLYQLQHG